MISLMGTSLGGWYLDVVEAIVCLLVTHRDCERINNISKRTRCDEKIKTEQKSVEHEMICSSKNKERNESRMNNHNDNNDGDEVRALMNHIILDELCVLLLFLR